MTPEDFAIENAIEVIADGSNEYRDKAVAKILEAKELLDLPQ